MKTTLVLILLILHYVQSQCNNNCGNGYCVGNTYCDCNPGFAGPYCDLQVNETVTINNSGPILNYPEGNFTLSYIREVDPIGQIVKEYSLKSVVWNQTTPQTGKYNLTQEATVDIDISSFSNHQNFTNFFGEDIPVYNNTVNFQVTVQNYHLSNTLNSLDLVISVDINQYCKQIQLNNSLTLKGKQNLIFTQFPPNSLLDDRVVMVESAPNSSPNTFSIRIPYFYNFVTYRSFLTVYKSEYCETNSSSTTSTTGDLTTSGLTTTTGDSTSNSFKLHSFNILIFLFLVVLLI